MPLRAALYLMLYRLGKNRHYLSLLSLQVTSGFITIRVENLLLEVTSRFVTTVKRGDAMLYNKYGCKSFYLKLLPAS